MKKYIYLKEGEIITPDVELHDPEGKFWEGNDYTNTPVAKNWVGYFRRPIPHAGGVQFLMAVSIMVPVIVNCDGKEQEVIEAEAGELAYQKVLDDPRKYINYESIDWAACKVDEIQPEPKKKSLLQRMNEKRATLGVPPIGADTPKNPGQPLSEPKYRPFVLGDVLEHGDQFRFNEDDEWRDLTDPEGPIDQSIIDSGDFRKLMK